MTELQSYGAAGEVTGSCHVVTDNKKRQVLVDYGMFQGADEHNDSNYVPPNFDSRSLAGVVLTHAHLDHSGRLPLLTQAGYTGPIYATEPTKELMRLVLADSAEIQRKNAQRGGYPLYDHSDVGRVMSQVEPISYGQPFEVGGFTATFRDAGHILGSASVEMTEREVPQPETILFSGDLGNDDPRDILKSKQLVERADIVVMETTYGDREHSAENPEEVIMEEINAIERNGGTLLIPAFSIERTQRLLRIIHDLKEEQLVRGKTRVFLDSPMGHKATTIFNRYRDHFQDDIRDDDDPFNFEGFVATPNSEDSRRIQQARGAKIIIAGSGMMNGGRIRRHATNYLENPRNRILFCGYQSPHSLGGLIQSGVPEVMIDHEYIRVFASVNSVGSLSAHADQGKLLEWLDSAQGKRKVVLVHGGDHQRQVFAGKVAQEVGIDADIPYRGDTIDLTLPQAA